MLNFGTWKSALRRLPGVHRWWLQRMARRFNIETPTAAPSVRPEEILLIAKVRNEADRLPYFFEYYRELGVQRFLILDNESEDQTAAICAKTPNCHRFMVRDTFHHSEFWIRYLLEKYGRGHWCLVVDADELLVLPKANQVTLPDVVNYLDAEGSSALHCMLLDMYSREPVSRIHYQPGMDPRTICPYYDREADFREESREIFGGVRERVFDCRPFLHKTPLFRYHSEVYLGRGAHLARGVQLSPMRGVLLHFKFVDAMVKKALEESARGQYANDGAEYKAYQAAFAANPDLSLLGADSTRYEGPSKLEEDGLLRSSDDFDQWIARRQKRA